MLPSNGIPNKAMSVHAKTTKAWAAICEAIAPVRPVADNVIIEIFVTTRIGIRIATSTIVTNGAEKPENAPCCHIQTPQSTSALAAAPIPPTTAKLTKIRPRSEGAAVL